LSGNTYLEALDQFGIDLLTSKAELAMKVGAPGGAYSINNQ